MTWGLERMRGAVISSVALLCLPRWQCVEVVVLVLVVVVHVSPWPRLAMATPATLSLLVLQGKATHEAASEANT